MAEALYRKYRPQIFEDVVGQEHIERTIKNAIDQDKVSHAYLFTGPRGTGKTTTARLVAKALLCEKGPTSEPDGTCSDCVMVAEGEHPDVYELDAASRTGVENVREEIIGRVQFAPTRGRYKVYIIDEVHMLSAAAFNALLKTLEEPPSHVVFILCTTDPQKVPETIHSRCQRFDFRRISLESIVSRLGAVCVSEGVEFEGEALDLVAHHAEGGMRNALTSLEQLIAFGEGKVTLEVAERMLGAADASDLADIMRAIGTRDAAACFRWTASYVETGVDLAQFTRDLAEHVRSLYVLSLAGADAALELGDAARRALESELQWFGPDRLARLLCVLGDLSSELKTSTNQRLSFEIALTRMVRPDSDITLAALAERVEALEARLASGAPSPSASPAGAAARSAHAVQPAASVAEGESASVRPLNAGQSAGRPSSAQGGMPAVGSARARDAALGAAQAQPASPSASSAPSHARPVEEAGLRAAQPERSAGASASAAVRERSDSAVPAVGQGAAGAAGAAPATAGLENPAALQRVWQAALFSLKKEKAAYGVLFLNTKASYDAATGALAIDFPPENSFAFKAVQKPDVQAAVAAALGAAYESALPFRYTQGAQAASPAAPSQAAVAQRQPEADSPAAGAWRQPAADAGAEPAQSRVGQERRAAAPAQHAMAPEPEPTPLDAYDLPPYEDEVVPYEDEYAPMDLPPVERAASSPAQVPAEPSRGGRPAVRPAESMQAPAEPAWQPHSAAEPAQRVSPAASPDGLSSADPGPSMSPDDLQALLTAGFGEGVVFEELRE